MDPIERLKQITGARDPEPVRAGPLYVSEEDRLKAREEELQALAKAGADYSGQDALRRFFRRRR